MENQKSKIKYQNHRSKVKKAIAESDSTFLIFAF